MAKATTTTQMKLWGEGETESFSIGTIDCCEKLAPAVHCGPACLQDGLCQRKMYDDELPTTSVRLPRHGVHMDMVAHLRRVEDSNRES